MHNRISGIALNQDALLTLGLQHDTNFVLSYISPSIPDSNRLAGESSKRRKTRKLVLLFLLIFSFLFLACSSFYCTIKSGSMIYEHNDHWNRYLNQLMHIHPAILLIPLHNSALFFRFSQLSPETMASIASLEIPPHWRTHGKVDIFLIVIDSIKCSVLSCRHVNNL